MYPDRNRVLCLILPGLVLGLLLVYGLTGCTTGANTESTQGPGETQAQPQARDNMARELADLREKVAKLERDNEALQRHVKQLDTLSEDVASWCLPEDLAAISADLQNVNKETADLRQKVTRLQHDNEALQKTVEFLETLLRSVLDWPPQGLPAIEAVVQKVNEDLKFVMLSVGRDDKVIKGMRFYVSRKGSYVGEVEVDSVYPKSSSASYVRLKPGMSIQVGDTATTRL
jgi:archaellum component FlaC